MSRMTAPVEGDIPADSRPAFAAAHHLGFLPEYVSRAGSHPKAPNDWLDLSKAMSASLDVATRQGAAHTVDEINA